jgi:hypothetical protein
MALRMEKAFGVSMDTPDADAKQLRHRPARKREGEIKVMPFTGKPLEPHAVA